jgi:hypothetical protein
MPARAAWWPGVILFIVLVVVGCTSANDVDDAEFVASPTPTPERTPSPTPDGEETPTPTQPPATPVPSGSFLRIDGVAVRQVVLWDDDLPAEYAATRFTLYHRADVRAWSHVGNLPAEGRIIANPVNPDTLYLGDHPPCLREGEPQPFYRSFDAGKTWERMDEASNIRPIIVWAEDTETVIGSRCGLVISRDQGETWNRYLPETEFDLTRLTATQIGLYGIFTAQNETSYLRRIDLDDQAAPEFGDAILSFWGRGVVHATSERIIVGEPSGVHLSDDGGRTWSFTREGLEDVVASVNPLEESIPDRELEAGIGIYSLLPHPQDSSRIFLGTIRGLYLSEDGGQSWGKIPEIDDHEIHQLNFAMGGAILYVTTTEGVIILHNP